MTGCRRARLRRVLLAAFIAATHTRALPAQTRVPAPAAGWADEPPALSALVRLSRTESDLRVAVNRYLLDKAAIERRYEVPYSPVRNQRLRTCYQGWQRRLAEADFDGLNPEGRIDYVMLGNRVEYDLESLGLSEARWTQMATLVPFFDSLRLLPEDRFDRKRVDPRAAATTLNAVAKQIDDLTSALAADANKVAGLAARPGITPVVASRAASVVDAIRVVMTDWNAFYDGYDPLFSWWAREPYGRLDTALIAYRDAVRRHLAGIRPGETAPVIRRPAVPRALQGAGRRRQNDRNRPPRRDPAGGYMPVELVRARLTGEPLTRDYKARWRFAGDPGAK